VGRAASGRTGVCPIAKQAIVASPRVVDERTAAQRANVVRARVAVVAHLVVVDGYACTGAVALVVGAGIAVISARHSLIGKAIAGCFVTAIGALAAGGTRIAGVGRAASFRAGVSAVAEQPIVAGGGVVDDGAASLGAVVVGAEVPVVAIR
jgi:hypothetical protein